MLKCRVIPILTFNGFALVKTKKFAGNPRMVGNAIQAARVFNSRNVDELVFVDIYASDQRRKINLQVVQSIINECFMPVSIGGGITSIEDIDNVLAIGADKVLIKNKLIEQPGFIDEAANIFGNQCITLAIDAIKIGSSYFLYNRLDKTIPLVEFLKSISSHNFGEIVLTSVEHDGMMDGFDIELVQLVEKLVNVPIVVSGGAGEPKHFKKLFSETNIEAVGAASIFYFTRYTPYDVKKAISSIGKPVRINGDNFIL